MDMDRQGVLLVFIGLLAVCTVESLNCYQCADTTDESPCIHDYKGFINTTKGTSKKYHKQCELSNPRWDRCVIEVHLKDRGSMTYIKRDCHDGVLFSKINDDDEFKNLTTNNYTTCSYVTDRVVCFTFCQEDYCNGPREVECVNKTEVGDDHVLLHYQEYCGVMGIHGNGFATWFLQIVAVAVVLVTYNYKSTTL